MSQQQVKQEPVELLENDNDDIHSIAGSEWTVNTMDDNDEEDMMQSEQECAKMKADQAIAVKLEDAKQKAQMEANTELTNKMEEMEAHFAHKLFSQEQQIRANFDKETKLMEAKHQKEMAELKAKTVAKDGLKLEDAALKAQIELTKKIDETELNFVHKLASRNGDLRKEIESLHIQIGQMAEEAKSQKTLEQQHLKTIGQMVEEAKTQKTLDQVHLQTIGQLRATVAQQTKEPQSNSGFLTGFYILRYIICIVLSLFCFSAILKGGSVDYALCLSVLFLSLTTLFGY